MGHQIEAGGGVGGLKKIVFGRFPFKNEHFLERRKKMKRILSVIAAVAALTCFLAVPAFSADKLVVKDSGGTNTVFAVEDGTSVPNRGLRVLSGVPIMQNSGNAGFDIQNTAASFPAAIIVGPAGNPNLYGNWSGTTNAQVDTTKVSWGVRMDVVNDMYRVLRAPSGGGAMAVVMDVHGDGSIASKTGASLSAGGTWVNASSRTLKENIKDLTDQEATATLAGLTPVKYNYKVDKNEKHVGFIAEDVPSLVATKDRKGLSSMDIVAVLTKVVQDQQKTIAALTEKVNLLEGKVSKINSKDVVGSLRAE